jgi:hypothetical protein
LAEFERMAKLHADQAEAHLKKSQWYVEQLEELKKENE